MAVIVRSWNVFHGNADPPRRRGYLRRMVELATVDRPGILCLQELPVWALPRVDDWSGMQRFAVVTRPPLWPGPVSAWVTRLHQGLFRSGLAGQANAVLLGDGLEGVDLGHERISDHGRERRLVHAVRVTEVGVVAHLHATNDHDHPEVPRAELDRALAFAESLLEPGEPLVLVGDLNLVAPQLTGFSTPGAGIDHILVRGLPSSPLVTWERERRLVDGVLLSDHAPVETRVG